MLEALDEAQRVRWTTTDDLLRTLIEQVRMVWRQTVVNGGNDDPGPLDIRRPGDPEPKKSGGLRAAVMRATRGRR